MPHTLYQVDAFTDTLFKGNPAAVMKLDDFLGHATIATAHVLAAEYGLTPPFTFETKIGRLSVDIIDGRYVLDAPVSKAAATVITEAMRSETLSQVQPTPQ